MAAAIVGADTGGDGHHAHAGDHPAAAASRRRVKRGTQSAVWRGVILRLIAAAALQILEHFIDHTHGKSIPVSKEVQVNRATNNPPKT